MEDAVSDFNRYFAAVQQAPNSFTSWEYVLSVVNKEPIETIRQTFDAFLSRFPLCYGYWNQYAQCEANNTAADAAACFDAAKAVYERAAVAVTYSVENWLNYGTFMYQKSGDVAATREVYQRAIQTCLFDSKCVQLFEAFVLFEQAHSNFAGAAKVYRQGINVGMPYGDQLWPAFCQFASLHDFDVLATEEGDAEAVPEVVAPVDHSDAPAPRKDRLLATIENEYKAAAAESAKREPFERAITRSFFTPKPLAEEQLANWRAYLTFEQQAGDHRRIEGIFCRALVVCALYAEFWERYARWKAKTFGAAVAVNALYPAVAVFLPNRPDLQLLYARLLECSGSVADARAVHESLASGIGKDLVEAIVNHSNFERRHGNSAVGADLLKAGFVAASGDAKLFLGLQWASYLERAGDIPGCRAAFVDITLVEPGCSSATVWLLYAAFELRFGADRVQDARQVFQAGLMSASISESGRDEIWRRYLDFLEDCSASAEEIVLAEGQYRDWVADSDSRNNSTDPSLPASSQASGYDASKKRSALEMVQPVSKAARTEEPAAAAAPASASSAAPSGYDYSAYYQQYYGAAAAAYGAYPGYTPQ